MKIMIDGDGYSVYQGDCDGNPDVNPGETEIPDNAIDDDCNPATPDSSDDSSKDEQGDNDGDGYNDDEGDCDDNDPDVNPGATEIPGNGIDDDCDSATSDNATEQTYIDYINDPGNTSSGVANYLVANSPLSDSVLLAVINRNPLLDDHANYEILIQYNGLSENVLNAMINEGQLLISTRFQGGAY